VLLLHYVLKLQTIDFGNVGVKKRDAENLGTRPRGKIEIGALGGTCTHNLPADNGLLFYSATRAKWWEVLVTLQSVASDTLFCDSRFTVGQPDHFPELVAGVGVAPTVAELMRLA
jgi:hypothetical protein